jgi:hypothetical protein
VPVAQCNVGSYPRSRQRSTSRVNPRRADGPCQRVSRYRRGRSACRRPARSVHAARGMKSLRAAEARTRSSTACAGGAPSYVPSSLRPLNVLDLARRAPHQAHRPAHVPQRSHRPRLDPARTTTWRRGSRCPSWWPKRSLTTRPRAVRHQPRAANTHAASFSDSTHAAALSSSSSPTRADSSSSISSVWLTARWEQRVRCPCAAGRGSAAPSHLPEDRNPAPTCDGGDPESGTRISGGGTDSRR